MHKYMLNTNIVIYVIKRRPLAILDKLKAHARHMALSSIRLLEWLHGVEKSAAPKRNMQAVKDFISCLDGCDYDQKTALHYGFIRANLETQNTPISVNDLYISGHARSAGLILVTNNIREFERIHGLIVENWIQDES